MTDLTINELKGKRAKLEADLYLSISKLIDDFQHQNDVAVMNINIDLVPTQAMQELRPTYVLSGVGVTIDV